MPQKKTYFDLQERGARILRKFAVKVVGSSYAFTTILAEELNCGDYSARRYMTSLTKELLLDRFSVLDCAITKTLDRCCSGELIDIRSLDTVKHNRELFEAEFMEELRKLHEQAVDRYIS